MRSLQLVPLEETARAPSPGPSRASSTFSEGRSTRRLTQVITAAFKTGLLASLCLAAQRPSGDYGPHEASQTASQALLNAQSIGHPLPNACQSPYGSGVLTVQQQDGDPRSPLLGDPTLQIDEDAHSESERARSVRAESVSETGASGDRPSEPVEQHLQHDDGPTMCPSTSKTSKSNLCCLRSITTVV